MQTNHFHVKRASRERFQLSKELFSISGNVVFADFAAAKDFAHKLNLQYAAEKSGKHITPGNLYAMGLIDEISHFIFHLYRTEIFPQFSEKLFESAERETGEDAFNKLMLDFVREFPTSVVASGGMSEAEFLAASTNGVPNRFTELEELILLKIANENPAFSEFDELFGDSKLAENPTYSRFFDIAEKFFAGNPKIDSGGEKVSVLDLLRAPFKASPNSLAGQLEFIRKNWGVKISARFSKMLLLSADIIKEETKPVFGTGGGGDFPALTKDALAGWGEGDPENENFSKDSLWMPRVVMIAKNIFVWLDQLSKQYSTDIHTLDRIPDEELETLSRRGFTALWLIGLWERSKASKRIKQIMGNPEAAASAYSLYDYEIAAELGGEAAMQNLRERAWRHGIRLASDMVPNHTAIDSKWISEHPEWFISADEPPFPAYTYNGENLSSDPNIGIYIEDHYYSKSDAAVTFKRVDFRTGKTDYIYHGNDGTCMPWNDTAQLNYMRADVREQVIQTIIKIAKNFPVIRFDAAMTLAKRHYHRLWFPEPGSGGDIASRAEHGLTTEEFNKFFPKEFWREVVDRVAVEAPDTLLLAEAFWLMEGYFVRTLGMHRVYNSAFMNFMKNEENAKYRQSVKSVLEFDPHILERYVNFLNNPDEETAVAQFGDNDKYFGVTLLMITMPGLPMFGHGQIEGFSEKYGMEYRRAYKNESVNQALVERHEREIFPLLHLRRLFAHVDDFHFYDFYRSDGSVDENVFAYSNGWGESKVLVFYHNRFAETSGWIKQSCAWLDKGSGELRRINLDFALGLKREKGTFVRFKELISGKEYTLSTEDIFEHGFYIHLKAYEYRVFTDFKVVSNINEDKEEQMDFQLYIDAFNSEVVPALGCTEPIAVALAAATSAKLLGRPVERAEIALSGNIMKNGLGVGIPGTGMVGLPIAAALGIKGGDPSKELEVLCGVTKEHIAQAKEMVKKGEIAVSMKEKVDKLYIEAICFSGKECARTVICGSHTNIVLTELNGKIVSQKSCNAFSFDWNENSQKTQEYHMTVEGIWNFINKVPLEKIRYVLEGAEMNKKIALEGLSGDYGLRVGKTLRLNVQKGLLADDLANYAMALTAAASDARMAGCTLSVMSNSGSGNQGITVMMPIVATAERLGSSEEKLIRALYLGNLIAIHLKEFMSKLSALCGTVTASTGAACGITYLMGGNLSQINYAIKNMIGNISGMICDGAKAGCALKVSTTINAALQSALLAIENIEISETDGIIERDIEKTIKNLATVASEGMEKTDEVILDIMTCK
jgi:L-cysteine desulfidase/glycosidase